ncbi:MAG: hypothetical protein HY047_19430 [Acidobacteria bacterium]|nr:hypothetical protein [Acidobacteriota bacterium]
MPEVTRARFTFAGEWITAAVFCAATVLVGLLIVRELRGTPRLLANETAIGGPASAAVPADAVSVPSLVLGAHEIRVGDRRTDALAQIDSSMTMIRRTEERGPLGPRETRAFQLAGTSFILVFEPFELRGEPRVAAIYLQ